MKKIYIKELAGCFECTHFCEEGEFCHHPKWKTTHVVEMFEGMSFIEGFTFPLYCPLPDNSEVD